MDGPLAADQVTVIGCEEAVVVPTVGATGPIPVPQPSQHPVGHRRFRMAWRRSNTSAGVA